MKLYKYRRFNVQTLRLITEAEIFYAQPRTFNDLMDCDPTIEVDVDREALEKLLFRQLAMRRNQQEAGDMILHLRHLADQYRYEDGKADLEDYLIGLLAGEVKDELDAELGQCGVLSLSASWSSALLWSHYADEHRGICIEYETGDHDHPHLAKVDYRAPRAVKASDLLRWKLKDDTRAADKVRRTYFYAKSREWQYEREWRDIQADSGVKGVPFQMTGILFGMRCDLSAIKAVVKLLTGEKQIKLWSVLAKESGFALRRAPFERQEIDASTIRVPSFLVFRDVLFSPDAEMFDPAFFADDLVPDF